MRYFVTLEGQEFPLGVSDTREPGRAQIGRNLRPTSGHELAGASAEGGTSPGTELPEARSFDAEILRPARQGRPALLTVGGKVFRVVTAGAGPAAGSGHCVVNGRAVRVAIETETERRARPKRDKSAAGRVSVVAPMPGRIVKVNVVVGEVVAIGAALLGIEAMKMENELESTAAGRIASLTVKAGDAVDADQELMVIEPA